MKTRCLESQLGSIRSYPGGGRLKAVKRRRKTVATIGKLTKTMSVVAASKMVPAQQKAAAISPFFTTMNKTFKDLTTEPKDGEKVLTLVISTDKGLCGSTNNGLTRFLLKQDLSSHSIVVWGDKGCGAFERSLYKNNVIFSAHPNQKTVLSFSEVCAVSDKLSKLDFDVCKVVFNKLISSSSPAIQQIYLPSLKRFTSDEARNALTPYEIEATADDELVVNMFEFFFASGLNYACFHNQAVEMFARRNSMDNATKNAKEVAKKLLLKFNRERQAMITTELGEITSGAAAVEEGSKK
uniref:F-ATPase gamma subunit n=1 Tax=Arcella intermedia TaxID=1963864 RepID=A0A6B2LBL3_9EUKA